MGGSISLKLRKVVFALAHPLCWPALRRRVAPSLEHREILHGLDFDLLIDVGANRGQFSLMTRSLHPRVPIHGFEPLPSEGRVYRELLGRDSSVHLHELALGEEEGVARLHVSARADSSSLLPIGELQSSLFPDTVEVGSCEVPVRRLDAMPEVWQASSKALLKLDVQGFELSVLRGAVGAFDHCRWIYAECSHVPLYDGQALYKDVESFLGRHGFVVRRCHNQQLSEGTLVQADYLFERAAMAAPAGAGGVRKP